MKMCAVLLGATMLLAGCTASHKQTLNTQPPASAALATPQSGASEAARAAGAESRKVINPKIRDVPVSGVAIAAIARATALVTPRSGASEAAHTSRAALVAPQSGASEAAKAAGAESRSVIIPKLRDVPASGVRSEARALPYGVPYASDTDPIRIISCILSSTTVHPGDKITGDVVTSSNAASVTARVGAFSVEVPKVAPGKFHLLLQLPSMPLPPGDTKLIVTAVRTDGKSTRREVAVTVVL